MILEEGGNLMKKMNILQKLVEMVEFNVGVPW